MNKQRKFVLIAAAVGLISMFLPWISIPFLGSVGTVNGMHDIGILAFLCFVVSGIIAYLGDQTKNLDKNMWGVVLAAGALALIIVIWFYFKINDSVMGGSLVGFGLYIAAIGAIGILGAAYILRSPTENIKDSFNSMKKNIESKIGTPESTTPPSPPPPPPPTAGSYQDPGNTNPPV